MWTLVPNEEQDQQVPSPTFPASFLEVPFISGHAIRPGPFSDSYVLPVLPTQLSRHHSPSLVAGTAQLATLGAEAQELDRAPTAS